VAVAIAAVVAVAAVAAVVVVVAVAAVVAVVAVVVVVVENDLKYSFFTKNTSSFFFLYHLYIIIINYF
jgi:hypothetical protein